ncbi:MAG TPA: thiamine phosphate synthase [Terriglobales bacterium]|nr:thiamine phosphate synthase [Terriglobales bacterium]
MSADLQLPRLYAILDPSRLPPAMSVAEYAQQLIAGGVRLLQYRNKSQMGKALLADAAELKRIAKSSGSKATLIFNDRPDLCVAAGFDGVHLGQDDISTTAARVVCKPPVLIGLSTHNLQQVKAADKLPIDYIAIGPVFATATKTSSNAVVGLQCVRQARQFTDKPLVAIGGITRKNCRSVIEAGADSVAVISDLAADGTPRQTTEEFLKILR